MQFGSSVALLRFHRRLPPVWSVSSVLNRIRLSCNLLAQLVVLTGAGSDQWSDPPAGLHALALSLQSMLLQQRGWTCCRFCWSWYETLSFLLCLSLVRLFGLKNMLILCEERLKKRISSESATQNVEWVWAVCPVSLCSCCFPVTHHCFSVYLCRTMLTKDKKPDEKDKGKVGIQVIPPRPDTPKMFKAALKVTQQEGIEGTLSKLRETYKPSDSEEVRLQQLMCECCSWSTVGGANMQRERERVWLQDKTTKREGVRKRTRNILFHMSVLSGLYSLSARLMSNNKWIGLRSSH